MRDEQPYTIGELAEAAGVTPRTIRYYTAEGLLPKPDARGQYALYGDEHLLRLRLIARLKDAYLPLGEIRSRIENLDAGQVRQLLDEPPASPAAPEPVSAADYVAQVLHRQTSPQMLAETTARYGLASEPPLQAAAPPSAAAPAMLPPASPASLPPAPPYGFAAAASAPRELPGEVPRAPARPEGALRRMLSRRREQPAAEPQTEERWRRIALASGVELHVREPVAPALRERIEQLIASAARLMADKNE